MAIYSVHETGGKGIVVSAETSISKGLPTILLIGFAGKSLDESRERIRSAFSSANIALPKRRITVNISPSDVPKDGAHYDLAIALSILQEAGMIRMLPGGKVMVFGELGLDGSLKPVRGLLGKLICAIEEGYTHFIIPTANLQQATLIDDIYLFAADSLKHVYEQLVDTKTTPFAMTDTAITDRQKEQPVVDFSEVVGQASAKRALEIAAAGGHNIILNGPPGVGKSMLAKAVPGIMTSPSKEETITITHLHSLTNDAVTDLVQQRPFRSPHHSSSDVSVIGGGQRPRPGEVSLAHEGVLFLDELPEFRRSTIESLRQPLEDAIVTVARAKDTVTYPARFMLVATKNPCPCGYYGSTKPCTCSPLELDRYQKKLSGPILDRIDIHVTVDTIKHTSLLKEKSDEERSAAIKQRVTKAQQRQLERHGKQNGRMSNRDIKQHVRLSPEAKEFLDTAAEKLEISARVYMKMVKIAQTIADLESADSIRNDHIAEALQYRPISQM